MQHRHEAGPRLRRAASHDAEELVVATIAAHADALLRTARRHSLCLDDAHDAYQRGLEIFLRHAGRLEPERASRWLHTVVKHEAMAVRASRQKLVGGEEFDPDAQVAGHVASPEERVLTAEVVERSAEALQRLKPQEVRALWLKAEGLSYQEIAERCGWSYTKVNRCVTEGRRAFLARYAGIETGAECERWAGALSAVVDGEAGAEDLRALRPHLRNCAGCRATLRALREMRPALGALFPVALVLGAPTGEATVGLFVRVYEAVVGGLQERAVSAVTKAQALVEATGAAKVTAVAASAAAVAGGGAATVERVAERSAPAEAAPAQLRPAESVVVGQAPRMRVVPASAPRPKRASAGEATGARSSARSSPRRAAERRAVVAHGRERRAAREVEEFGVEGVESAAAPGVTTATAASPQPASTPAHEFATAAPPSSPRPTPPSAPPTSGSSSGGSASSSAVADEFGPEG